MPESEKQALLKLLAASKKALVAKPAPSPPPPPKT